MMDFASVGSDGFKSRLTANGTEYVTLSSGGIVPEGATFMVFDGPADAWDAFRKEFDGWLSGRDPAGIVWRHRPEVASFTPLKTRPMNGEERTTYYVFSRVAWEEPKQPGNITESILRSAGALT